MPFACYNNADIRKTFTADVRQMQRRRHHMTACGLLLSSFVLEDSRPGT